MLAESAAFVHVGARRAPTWLDITRTDKTRAQAAPRKHTCRTVRESAAIASLALGIGLNVSVFSVVAPTRIGAMVVGAVGALALLLAGLGLYGVVAYSVSRRTREVGIRMALGAERWRVLRLILAQGGRLALAGVVLGAVASLGVGRMLESLLYGVSGFDPIAYGGAAGVLLVAAGLATLVPALAASRVDPMRALRSE